MWLMHAPMAAKTNAAGGQVQKQKGTDKLSPRGLEQARTPGFCISRSASASAQVVT